MEKLNENGPANVINGFRKCGIVPFNPEEVLSRLPEHNGDEFAIESSFETYLRELRYGNQVSDTTVPRRKKARLAVEPGKSVTLPDDKENQESSQDASGEKNYPNE